MKAHGYKLIIFSCAPTKFIHNNPICSYFAFSFFLGIDTTRNMVISQGQKPWQNAKSLVKWTFARSFAMNRITSKSAHRK